jgi:hypothetical protein
MKSEFARRFGAALSLVLLGTGASHALSLRGASAELALSESGTRLKVENTGVEPVRVEFVVAAPKVESCKDGYEPWPFPSRVRVETIRRAAKPGEAAEAEVSASAPKGFAPQGGQYELDALATGRDEAGLTLTVKTRLLLSLGGPLASEKDVVTEERAGFSLAPKSAIGKEATVKIVNAEAEDLSVSITAAKDWSGDVRFPEGYEPVPNPRWLRSEPAAQRIRAGEIGRARIWADVPREKRYAGRRWAFVAAVDAVAGGRTTRRYFVLSVETPKEEDKRAR